ncbi:MAG: AsmA-like C-terminal region-containing protein [Elusimicrobiota bacterium]|jgi:hypothetical protein|nr:AsmA-like C-terminal region-containing protein [Elusimicrobiota bacterium]
MSGKKISSLLWRGVKFCARGFLRAAFALTALLLIAALGAWIFIVKYFNAQYIGAIATQALQHAFNRPVVMGSIKLVSLNAVEVENLKIIDAGFEFYNEVLSVDSVVVRYNILPLLLESRLEIEEVILNRPALNIVKAANGRTNIVGLAVTSREVETGQQFDLQTAGGARQISIEDWSIKDGTLSFRDIGANESHSLNGLHIFFDDLKFNAFSDFSLNFVLRNKIKDKVIETEIIGSGSVNLANFAPQNMALEDGSFEVRALRRPLLFKLSARDFTAPQTRLTADLPAFTYDDISLFLPKPVSFALPPAQLQAQINFTNSFNNIDAPQITFKNADVELSLKAQADMAAQKITAGFQTGDFNAEAADYFNILKPYKVRGPINARGNVIYDKAKLSMSGLEIDLKGVSSDLYNFTVRGVYGKYAAEQNFNVMNAVVDEGTFKVGRQSVQKIKGRASYEHKKDNFYALLDNSRFNGQNIRMSVAISNVKREQNRVIKVMTSVDTFNPKEVFDTVVDFADALSDGPSTFKPEAGDMAWLRNFKAGLPDFMQNIKGSVFAKRFESPVLAGENFNAEVNVRGMVSGMARLSGKVDARLENGTIYKLQEMSDRYAALGIAFQPFVIMNNMERAGSFKVGQVLKDTPFEIMTASADFNNGKMDINNFYLDGRVIAAAVEGRVDWVGEDMDLEIYTMFKNTSKRGALSENLTDESGEPALAFRAHDTMQKPSVQMRSPKKTGSKIQTARAKGLRTSFGAIQKFVRER